MARWNKVDIPHKGWKYAGLFTAGEIEKIWYSIAKKCGIGCESKRNGCVDVFEELYLQVHRRY